MTDVLQIIAEIMLAIPSPIIAGAIMLFAISRI